MKFKIEEATEADAAELCDLSKITYRGDISKTGGWTSEYDIIDGDRSTKELVIEDMNALAATMLKYTDEEGIIRGCVRVDFVEQAEKKVSIGFLCVHPSHQCKGLGKQLMAAAENLGKYKGCTKSIIRVISIRTELIAWYERQKYKNTGELSPFVSSDGAGISKIPLEFGTWEKSLV